MNHRPFDLESAIFKMFVSGVQTPVVSRVSLPPETTVYRGQHEQHSKVPELLKDFTSGQHEQHFKVPELLKDFTSGQHEQHFKVPEQQFCWPSGGF